MAFWNLEMVEFVLNISYLLQLCTVNCNVRMDTLNIAVCYKLCVGRYTRVHFMFTTYVCYTHCKLFSCLCPCTVLSVSVLLLVGWFVNMHSLVKCMSPLRPFFTFDYLPCFRFFMFTCSAFLFFFQFSACANMNSFEKHLLVHHPSFDATRLAAIWTCPHDITKMDFVPSPFRPNIGLRSTRLRPFSPVLTVRWEGMGAHTHRTPWLRRSYCSWCLCNSLCDERKTLHATQWTLSWVNDQ